MRKGNTRSLLAFMAVLIAFSATSCRGRREQPSPESDAFPIEKLARYENCSIAHIGETWFFAAYSERSKGLPLRSEFLACRYDGGALKRAFSESFEDAYNASMDVRYDMEFKKNPIIVFRGNYGAAYTIMHVYGMDADSIRSLQTLEAGAFEWVRQDNGGGHLLAAIPAHMDERKIFYRWMGDRFSE
jgi:hypothetical protein